MALLPEGTRFALLRHMMSSPLHIVVMARCHDRHHGGRDDDDALIANLSPIFGTFACAA